MFAPAKEYLYASYTYRLQNGMISTSFANSKSVTDNR